jgi:hypothetical protein
MTEVEFITEIDCRFPYRDETKRHQLIELGASISPNAAFMVLHEICRPPRSVGVDSDILQTILLEWTGVFHHPLVDIVLPAAMAIIRAEEIPVEQSMLAMKAVSTYQNQFNALSIPYFACDDVTGEVDLMHQKIIDRWATKSEL